MESQRSNESSSTLQTDRTKSASKNEFASEWYGICYFIRHTMLKRRCLNVVMASFLRSVPDGML